MRTNHPDIPLAVPEPRRPWWPEERRGGSKPGTTGQLPRGMTLGLGASVCRRAAALLASQGTTSPQVAGQLSLRTTCLASVGKAKKLLRIRGTGTGLGLLARLTLSWSPQWRLVWRVLFSAVSQSCAKEGKINIPMCRFNGVLGNSFLGVQVLSKCLELIYRVTRENVYWSEIMGASNRRRL